MSALPMPDSLWAATAIAAPECAPLDTDREVDVAIVGAGFTGLTTALHLAERGVSTAVIDAGQPGWGASGRNGGQVIPGLKDDPDALVEKFGERGEALIEVIGRAADEVFALIERHGIDCQAVRGGWIQPALSNTALRTIESRAEQWRRRGVAVEWLDAQGVTARTGASGYLGGWVDPRAGAVQPLSLARGIARAAQQQGAAIHGGTRAQRLHREGKHWVLTTAQGARLRAERVVLATNGYSDGLWPGLSRTLIAAQSFIVATAPLAQHHAVGILPGGAVCSDGRHLLLYYRLDAANRLLLGGRGPFREARGAADWAHIERNLTELFPALAGHIRIEHRWCGRLALTRDHLPHYHEPAPGISILLGYNGRGVAMSNTLARHLAARLAGESAPFPLPITPIRPIPLHGLQRLYFGTAVNYYRLLDKLA
ncbi:NAD(P)/FAD-dependent oxidoreductase [Halotalea alkalilenta]|uniref:FAD-dependent oxidoreductase n=1 Tax=Halotalea alkalilenta TaxID=376489 RepID=A0A172YBX3_9GAMM|nr:FAD-dependent oxidoreductase [Halotalea alkalilenta]ANF56505.1 FAD-dependent oxidoreductase [Halotalea alkalilenta]